MEKKFKEYFSTGLKNSYKTLYKRRTNIFKYYVCLFIYILSMPLFLLKPVVNMGVFRLGSQINDDNDIELSSLIKSSDNPKNYFTALFAGLIKLFIIFGVIILIALCAGLLGLIGYSIMLLAHSDNIIIPILFASPALLLLLIYVILIPVLYAEIGYIVNSNNDINASNALNISFTSYKKQGKKNKFLIILINSLIKIALLAFIGLIAALPIIVKGSYETTIAISILAGVLLFIVYLVVSPLFTLATISSITILNDDVVKDTLTDIVSATNVKFSIPKKNIEDLTTEEKLAYIFDNADDLKPNIKDLKVLDSLDVLDEDGNYNNGKKVVKVEEKINKESKLIKEEIKEEKVSEPIEEKIEEVKEETYVETQSEEGNDFEAIKDISDENIKDSIIEDINSEKVSEEVEEKLDSEYSSDESNEFEAINDNKFENIDNVDEPNIIEEDEPIFNDEKTEEIKETDEMMNDSIKEENNIDQASEPTNEESIIEDNIDNDEQLIDNDTDNVIIEDVKNEDDLVNESSPIEEIAQESDNLEDIEQDNTESTEEVGSDEKEETLDPVEDNSNEFDEDLFKEEQENNDDMLEQMDEFLKKGGN